MLQAIMQGPDVTELSAPAASLNERRPSVVLKETRELLGFLNEDVNRSHELMAELESLLQASHATSQSAGTSALDAAQAIMTSRMSEHFTATEPLLAEDDSEEDDLEEQRTDLPTVRLKTINSVRRLSSTITLDGALLLSSGKASFPITTASAATASTALTSISACHLLESRRPGALIPRTSCQYSRCMSEARSTTLAAAHRRISGGSDSTAASDLDTHSPLPCGTVNRHAAFGAAPARRYSLNVEHLMSPASVTSGPQGRASTNGGMHQLPSVGHGKVSRTDTGFVEMPPLLTSPVSSRKAMPAAAGEAASGALPPVPGATRFNVGLVGRAMPLLRATSNVSRIFGRE